MTVENSEDTDSNSITSLSSMLSQKSKVLNDLSAVSSR